jgi:hypothetical protein
MKRFKHKDPDMLLSTTYTGHILKFDIRQAFSIQIDLHIIAITDQLLIIREQSQRPLVSNVSQELLLLQTV